MGLQRVGHDGVTFSKHQQLIIYPFCEFKGQFSCWSCLTPLMQLHSGLDETELPHMCVWGLGCDGWNV